MAGRPIAVHFGVWENGAHHGLTARYATELTKLRGVDCAALFTAIGLH